MPDTSDRPSPNRQQLVIRLLKAAVVFVVALEALDEVRAFWRRTSRKTAWWLSGVEQHEKRRLHMEEVAYLLRRLPRR